MQTTVSGNARPLHEQDRVVTLLRGVPHLNSLSDDDLGTVASMMRRVSYEAGEVIFRQGTAPDGMYLLESGRVQLWARVMDGRKDLIECGPGMVICESALVERNGRHVTAEAKEAVQTWFLDQRAFEGLSEMLHPAAFGLLLGAGRGLAESFRQAMQFFGSLIDHPFEPDGEREVDPRPPPSRFTDEDVPLLRVVPWMKALSDGELKTLITFAPKHVLPRGHRLLGEGHPASSLFLIVRGAIECSTTRRGERYRHGMRGPGRVVGESSFLTRLPQPMDFSARENSVLLEVEHDTFMRLYDARSGLGMRLLELCCAALASEFSADCRHFLKVIGESDLQASMSSEQIRGFSLRST